MSCNGTTFTYVVSACLLEAAKAQILRVTGDHSVVMMETPLEDGKVELLVFAGGLPAAQRDALSGWQQDVSALKPMAAADFASDVAFETKRARRPR